MFSTEDTIVAIATPPGRGGIGVVRLSGASSSAIACALTGRTSFEPRHATLTTICGGDESRIDRTVITFFPAPHSYTGDDVVEISAHGSPVVLRAIVDAAIAKGARLANPGEFTFRAFLNGRIDLVQAEAIGDLVDAVTPLQARVAFDQLDGTLTARLREMDAALLELIAPLEASLDFPDEGYHFVARADAERGIAATLATLEGLLADARRGRMIREGLTVAIVGRPNAGKSSLFNRLAGASRAIVTAIPGTTRDLLTERIDIGGVPFTVVDTAGLRPETHDAIEAEGIARARQAADAADVVLVVVDRSRPLSGEDETLLKETAERERVVVASKSDLTAAWDPSMVSATWHDQRAICRPDPGVIAVSALTDQGIGALREAIVTAAGVEPLRDGAAVANQRHAALLERARDALSRAAAGASQGVPEEFVLSDLHEARACFDEITGARPQDEVLALIFERFCIGK
ncbi:MAG TPA: tRNA uridine-5-carboxymethylaminomethyl(34) synthesis GTPase MnmE [Vicinamibacterales bacterium]|nr:tRNA uridine-5-carboxymethylaminomethyl(34) synthesis GTPase MnmE [Vicinamibacterales bacterium]